MANNALPQNINYEAAEAEWNKSQQQPVADERKSSFDEKNYLNVRLAKGEKKKTLKIRILPISATQGDVFLHIHFHSVEVPKEMATGSKPYKSYICLNPHTNPKIDSAVYGTKCPFCELNNEYYQESQKAESDIERKSLVKKSFSYKAKEAVIVRCIERGKEEEGVKFWKINLWDDKSDPYNKIMNIWSQRNEDNMNAVGTPKNIFDLNSGRDFTLTITEGNTENQVKIDVMDVGVDTPLSNNYEQAMSWINDPKTWRDVFGVKTYEYLSLVKDGKIPWYDRESKVWVDKEEYEARKNGRVAEENEQIKAAEQAFTQPQAFAPQAPAQPAPQAPQAPINNDDDLPF